MPTLVINFAVVHFVPVTQQGCATLSSCQLTCIFVCSKVNHTAHCCGRCCELVDTRALSRHWSRILVHPRFSSTALPLNLRGLIWLLMMVWSKRGNINTGKKILTRFNTAALVTIAQSNTVVARCSRQLIGPADWIFVFALSLLVGSSGL